ncbi:hypothetical protein ACL02T_29775 [Pseudonocardia sp. RS010]|uniref:hypothetical protein n=1 Tax=Pseudonocardia sp. RS010 TaxID=3385979 RepID=UPI00399F6CC3
MGTTSEEGSHTSVTFSGGAMIARPSGRLDGVSDLVSLLMQTAGSPISVVVFDLHDVTEVTAESAKTMAEFAATAYGRAVQVNVIGNDERVLSPLRSSPLISVWNTSGPSTTASSGPGAVE